MKKLLLALVITLVPAFGQTAAGLMPMPQQFFDGNGKPLTAGTVDTYAAGTTTRLATYTDSTGGVQNQNPVILDTSGRASIWLGASPYRVVVKASTGVVILDMSGITAPTLLSTDVTIPSGHALTLASGSTTSFATDLTPSGTRNLGSGAAHWSTAYVDFLNLYNSITLGATNSYDSGSPSLAWKNTYAFGGYVNKQNFCGTPGTLSSLCWVMTPTVDASNSYVTLKDQAGTEVMRWSQNESGGGVSKVTILGAAQFLLNQVTIPATSGIVLTAGSALLAGRNTIQNFSLSFASLSAQFATNVPLGTVGGFCYNCTTATVCTSGGTGHVAISDGTNWRCD